MFDLFFNYLIAALILPAFNLAAMAARRTIFFTSSSVVFQKCFSNGT